MQWRTGSHVRSSGTSKFAEITDHFRIAIIAKTVAAGDSLLNPHPSPTNQAGEELDQHARSLG
jgi:hypothetical protein